MINDYLITIHTYTPFQISNELAFFQLEIRCELESKFKFYNEKWYSFVIGGGLRLSGGGGYQGRFFKFFFGKSSFFGKNFFWYQFFWEKIFFW
jgi:hypothetical protein